MNGLVSTATIRLAPAEDRALNAVQTDTATADDGDRAARLDSSRPKHRTHAGRDGAADQGGPIERHVVADLGHGVLVNEHLLGQAPETRERNARRSVLAEARGLVGATLQADVIAKRRPASETEFALAAKHRRAGDDMVARLHVADLASDRLDHPG